MDNLRLHSKTLCNMIKSKIPNYEVPDTSKMSIDQLIDMCDLAVFQYINHLDELLKPNDKILMLYKHLLTIFEHHKARPKGWLY